MAFFDYRTWVTGELVGASHFNQDVRDNGKELWRELAYIEVVSDIGLATSEVGATQIVSSGAIVYAARPTVIEFFVPGYHDTAATGDTAHFTLWDSTTDLGRISSHRIGGTGGLSGVYARRRLTPTAASHTYIVKGWAVQAGFITKSGAGGSAGVYVPGFIRVLQKNG